MQRRSREAARKNRMIFGILVAVMLILFTALYAMSGRPGGSGSSGAVTPQSMQQNTTAQIKPETTEKTSVDPGKTEVVAGDSTTEAAGVTASEEPGSTEATSEESAYGWKKEATGWVYYKEDGSIMADRGSGYTIDMYLGCDNLIGWMMDHFNDYYFLTNFAPMYDYPNEPEKLLRPYGEYGAESSMNCTGFIAHLLKSAGGDLSKVSAMGKKGGYTNADNYLKLAKDGYIKYYTFDSVDEMLQSGKARMGDILYLEPDWNRTNADCHVGLYWGETGKENKFWNQNWNIKNAVTEIVMDDPIEKIYLFPIQGN